MQKLLVVLHLFHKSFKVQGPHFMLVLIFYSLSKSQVVKCAFRFLINGDKLFDSLGKVHFNLLDNKSNFDLANLGTLQISSRPIIRP